MASTYVNDLRLNEMATGDGSGTWGTTTNTNLELIAEAFGYGTEGITTNADTHTSTIADGATDPVRAHYVKYTGTLDSACTITIAPNTINRFHIIENATSGSQNIIIKQGTGTTVTIPNGHNKAVYLDGAGAGAAVVDAFTDVNFAGTTTVDDLTSSDDITVGDDLVLNSDSSIISMGAGADATFTHDGTTGVTIAANPITVDSGGDLNLDAHTGIFVFKDAGSEVLRFTEGNSGDVTIKLATNAKDLVFTDNGDATNMKILDAAAGINVPGEVQTTKIAFTDGDDAMTISDGGGVAFSADVSIGDNNITNVGSIALDSIASDAGVGTAITFSAGNVPNTQTAGSQTGNVTPDMSQYTNFVWTLTGNIVLQDPTDEVAGQSGIFVFIQDGTGSRTLSHADDRYFVAGGTSITLSTAASSIDIVPYFVQADGKIHLGAAQKAFAEA
jgi:hypothetical protein